MLFSKKELVTGLVVFLATVLVVAGFRWSILYNSSDISPEEPVHLYLYEKTDLQGVIRELQKEGFTVNQEELEWISDVTLWRTFHAGHYLIERPYSYHELLSKMARGLQDPVSVTILPGRMEGRVVKAIADKMKFDSLSLHQTIRDSAFLAQEDLYPEQVIGRLYPNTYDLYWNASPEAVLERIFNAFDRAVVNRFKERVEELDRPIEDIITLASIVEWEAHNDEEKATISGLYWNRLNQGMRLQSDPTINFAVGERRRLHYKDYKVDHPYNTYLHDGLPPGPITNPELSSIEAALYPETHDYLYMVASPEGSHEFSKTFEEHKQKSAKWRQWLQEQYRIKEQRESGSNQ